MITIQSILYFNQHILSLKHCRMLAKLTNSTLNKSFANLTLIQNFNTYLLSTPRLKKYSLLQNRYSANHATQQRYKIQSAFVKSKSFCSTNTIAYTYSTKGVKKSTSVYQDMPQKNILSIATQPLLKNQKRRQNRGRYSRDDRNQLDGMQDRFAQQYKQQSPSRSQYKTKNSKQLRRQRFFEGRPGFRERNSQFGEKQYVPFRQYIGIQKLYGLSANIQAASCNLGENIEQKIFRQIDLLTYSLKSPLNSYSPGNITQLSQQDINTYRNKILQMLQSEELKPYLAEKYKCIQRHEQNKFKFCCELASRLKSQGIGFYDVVIYQKLAKLIDQILGQIPQFQAYLTKITQSARLTLQKQKQRINILKEEIKKLQQQKQKQNQKQKQKQKQASSTSTSTQAQTQKQTKPTAQTRNLQKQLKIRHNLIQNNLAGQLLLNSPHIAQNNMSFINQLLMLKINDLSPFIVCTFMYDTAIANKTLQKQFLQQLYAKIDYSAFTGCYRYALIWFINRYQTTFSPLYPVYQTKKANMTQVAYSYEQIKNIVWLIAQQYITAQKSVGKLMLSALVKKITTLNYYVTDRKFGLVAIIKLYNQLAKVYPMGLLFIRDCVFFKDSKIVEQKLDICKQFVLNVLDNFQPNYIYSADERPTNQINESVIKLISMISKQILKIQPLFLLNLTNLFPYLSDKSNPLTQVVARAIKQIIQTLDLKNNSVKLVLTKQTQTLSQEQKHRRSNIIKLINFMHENYLFIASQNFNEDFQTVYDQIMQIDQSVISQMDSEMWKFLFQASKIIKRTYQQQDVLEGEDRCIAIYKHLCEEFIRNNQTYKQGNIFIRRPQLHYQYILRIANLTGSYISQDQTKSKQIVNFINNNFIYSAKSVIKQGIFQILDLFTKLKNVNLQIYAYLFSSLSTFIVYVQQGKKYYLKRGAHQEYEEQYIKLLKNAAAECDLLKNTPNKDRFNVLKTLMLVFWSDLSNRQIAQLLVIIGNPIFLPQKLRAKLQKNVTFTVSNIQGLDLETLSNFKLQNRSLFTALQNISPELIGGLKINSKFEIVNSQKHILRLFKNHEFYEKALQQKSFTGQQFVPPPEASSDKIKMAYACLKIAHKISKERNYSIRKISSQIQQSLKVDSESNQNQKRRLRKKPIDLKQELNYIKQHNLLKLNKINQFKLDNVEVKGHYEMVEGWSQFVDSNNFVSIEGFSTFGEADINPYEKVLLIINGNYGLIKQQLRRQASHPQLLNALMQLDIQVTTKGSLLQITPRHNVEDQIYIFCSTNMNYKLHHIYAYTMEQVGYKVFIVEEDTPKELVASLVKQYIDYQEKKNPKQNKIKVIEEQNQAIIQ